MAADKEEDLYEEERPSSPALILIAGLALLFALGALAWIYSLESRLERAENSLHQAQELAVEQAAQQAEMRRQLHAATEAFGEKVGITQRQIETRSEEIIHRQDAANTRLAQQEAATRQQVSSVSKDVSTVRGDVGGVKQDVASTRQELASTEQQLHAAIGDLGVQSGLIAKTQQQLDYLRRLGDRNYFQFTLHKGAAPVALSTIKLRLRKADQKHSRYSLDILSDDKRLEKKNRDLDEPLQFYSGKPPLLFEVVVNQIGQNEVSGYLSAPKSAPHPVLP